MEPRYTIAALPDGWHEVRVLMPAPVARFASEGDAQDWIAARSHAALMDRLRPTAPPDPEDDAAEAERRAAEDAETDAAEAAEVDADLPTAADVRGIMAGERAWGTGMAVFASDKRSPADTAAVAMQSDPGDETAAPLAASPLAATARALDVLLRDGPLAPSETAAPPPATAPALPPLSRMLAHWTDEEDLKLLQLSDLTPRPAWEEIAAHVSAVAGVQRTHRACEQRVLKLARMAQREMTRGS